jgi:hypothetical protein
VSLTLTFPILLSPPAPAPFPTPHPARRPILPVSFPVPLSSSHACTHSLASSGSSFPSACRLVLSPFPSSFFPLAASLPLLLPLSSHSPSPLLSLSLTLTRSFSVFLIHSLSIFLSLSRAPLSLQ